MRPGWYYFWRFAWATSPGTYAKALYLGTGLSATNISLISSVSNIMDMIFGAVIGNFADRFKFLDGSGYRNVGKEVILAVLFVVTTVLYGCQCVVSQFAVANTSSMMTLVGLSLDKLSIVSVLFLILAAVESAVKAGHKPVVGNLSCRERDYPGSCTEY
jgi:MFS family permease